jgi:hypothetical protein
MLSPQKYANTSRTITGLINFVFTSDVLLFCNTSAGAVALNLLEIPSGFWNTNYKLYVIDANNNAQTNNITINAPVGYQVNNASSFVISANGGIALIRVTNNTDYSVETNYGAGGLAVLNEGVLLTPNATSMDFIGSYVNATNIGNAVSVVIQPSIIALTYAQLLTNITNSTLIAGQMYSITNAIFIQTTGETTSVFLTATSTNNLGSAGHGLFYNADYQGTGNYSGVSGFVAQLGIWKGSLTPVIGDVVIWNNFHYKNISGNNSIPNLNPLDWTLLTKSATTGYIIEICSIEYNLTTNSIIQRSDLRENVIQNNIATYLTLGFEGFQFFQWGSNNTKSNNVNSEGAIQNCNNFASTLGNLVCSGGAIKILSGSFLAGVSASLRENSILEGSVLTFNADVTSPNFSFNQVSEFSVITIAKLGDPLIEGTIAVNQFSKCVLTLAPCSALSTIYLNRFQGTIGSIVNDFGSFSFNQFISSQAFTIDISNVGDNVNQALFQENQIFYCDLITLGNNGLFLKNKFEYTTITFSGGGNLPTKQIQYNQFFNSAFQILNVNDGIIIDNQCTESQMVLDTNSNSIRANKISGNSNFTITNNLNRVEYNTLENSTINVTNVNIACVIRNNELLNSQISVVTCNNSIALNKFNNYQFNVTTNSCSFSGNEVSNASFIANLLSTAIIRGVNGQLEVNTLGTFNYLLGAGLISEGICTTSVFLNLSDPTIYNPISFTLTIPSELEYLCGRITLTNGTAPISILKISGGLNATFGFMAFVNDSGFNVSFTSVSVGVAIGDQIISNLGATTYTLVDRNDGTDSICIRKLGAFNGVEQVYIYI